MQVDKKGKALLLLISIFTVEKVIQHIFLALAFGGFSPSLVPDIGTRFSPSHQTMVILNLLYAFFFAIGFTGCLKQYRWGLSLVTALAAFDIIFEFLFHGFFYITVSVLVSTILIILIIRARRNIKAAAF